jgi:hypothetical protein
MGEFLSSIGEAFGNLDGADKTALVTNALKIAPAIIGFNQASKAKNAQKDYLDDIKKIQENRQKIVNPYANVTNPFENMQVATAAAEMQAEQADLSLANTLDAMRETGMGAGGATALAQAALKSKQGISADIQKQEAKNAQLRAQGQQQAEQLQGRGAAIQMQLQEQRDNADLDRLQSMATIEGNRRVGGVAGGTASLSSMIGGMANVFMNPEATDFTSNDGSGGGGSVDKPIGMPPANMNNPQWINGKWEDI